MKKSDFITAVAKEAAITKVEAEKVVNAALKVIRDTLGKGDKVALTGFGTFEVRERAARAGMNIRTGERIRIPASKRPVFSAGSTLKSAVTGSKVAAKGRSKMAKAKVAAAKSNSAKAAGKGRGKK
jgi:DNA-binding protein HU-beta